MTHVGEVVEEVVARPKRRKATAPAFLKFLGRRVMTTIVLLWGTTVVGFLLVQAVPGDPVAANLSDAALGNPDAVRAFEERWGYDQPLIVQYFTYLTNLLRGDFGISLHTGRPVLQDLTQYVPATLEIALPAIIISLAVAIVLGVLAAIRHGKATDQAVRVLTLVGLSTPPFWLSILALYFFFYVLGVSPNGGRLSPMFAPPPNVTGLYTIDALLAGDLAVWWDAVQHLVLPVAVMSLITIATLTRFVRSAVLEALNKPFIESAEAKGIAPRAILTRHLLRAALIPIITMTGLAFASLLSGTVLVESVFSWPGVGRYAYESAISLDRPSILGATMFIAAVYLLVNLLVDILYGVADPRVRVQ